MMKSMTSNREMHVRPPFARRAMSIVLGTALLLLVPAVAMQFTAEMNWGPLDFVAAGAMLIGTGLSYEIAARKLRSPRARAIAAGVLASAFLLAWAELAVGILH